MKDIIGRIVATEKNPTTVDTFSFWTQSDLVLNIFDIVKVNHIDGSNTFGIIEDISHITDAKSALTNFISSDFGDVNIEEQVFRIGMNCVQAKVLCNTKNIYTPVQNNSKVYLSDSNEIIYALGLDNKNCTLPCGYIEMYENTRSVEKITIPVRLDPRFLIGPEGAHLNISGISGLAAKTSYAMFLLKSIQDYNEKNNLNDVAFVIFNVKGKDLMALHKKDISNMEELEKIKEIYQELGITYSPFKNVRYLIPNNLPEKSPSTFLSHSDVDEYISEDKLKKYIMTYEDDKEDIDLLFSNIDDSTQTMDAIQEYIISGQDRFSSCETWKNFLSAVSEKTQAGKNSSKEIPVQSWRKFYRIINKTIKSSAIFSNDEKKSEHTSRLENELKNINKNEVIVIDIATLDETLQAFIFGDAVRILTKFKLGEYDTYGDDDSNKPQRIIIFIDEINKYASDDVAKNSPILRQILDVTERGRSLGIVIFAAEQFRSAIHDRVKGNCSTHAYGRTNSIETSKPDYKFIPNTYKNILTRLNQGEYLIQNPVFKSILKIKFPKPVYYQFK